MKRRMIIINNKLTNIFVFYLYLLKINDLQVSAIATTNNSIDHSIALKEHAMVTDIKLFPYMAAILKKSTYISAGALIDESWVLTAADSLFT